MSLSADIIPILFNKINTYTEYEPYYSGIDLTSYSGFLKQFDDGSASLLVVAKDNNIIEATYTVLHVNKSVQKIETTICIDVDFIYHHSSCDINETIDSVFEEIHNAFYI